FVELLDSTERDPKSLERVAAAFTSHDAITTDVMHLTRCGRSYHVHLEIQPVTNHDEVVENFIVMETDITSRVEVEQQLRRAKQEADAASRAKSEFLASMSHEIRTPMNGVIGMTSLLNETPLTPEQRDYVQTIRTSGDALLSIINEILDFSKIESGHMELEHHPFELSQCIEETLDIFNLSAAAKEIEFAYSIEPDVPPWIVGDITRLRQILVNLVNNAVKFTPSGFITIETKRVAPADENGKVRLEFLVTDTGIGIPEDRHGVLFKTFSQVDSSTTRKYGGTGLGLAICDRLSQLMGGSIRMTSTLEKGSCFRFTILAEPATPPGGSKPLRFTDTAVLVVDDHPVNRRALEIALQQWGCQPLLASNSMSALEIFRAKQPLLAIIDYKIGSESGEALIEQLRHLHAQLPVILLTAASESVGRGNRAETTFMRLPKPVQPAFLGDCINRLLKGIQPRAKAQPASLSSSPIGDSIPLDILLVEDNPVNQKVALHLLDRLGYRADAVANGVEAVHAAQQRDYDLIFMDLQMPEMDGLTATQEIRRLIPRQQQPRIIALTANAVQGDRERCITAGMDDYVTKPVKLEQLHAVIEKYFRT
ncbi:MAG: response regulator, partial [Candidatus Didemnitutus sp.]|nr:response regulator [Candidatus Didemnitutus sp.]